jgi:uncharacterized cupin superfamily protein
MRAAMRDLGRAAGSTGIGARRFEVDPGCPLGPLHTHSVEEELFFVLGGDGISVQEHGAWAVGPGDVMHHPAMGPAHTLVAGEAGLDVLAFGTRDVRESIRLPRAQAVWQRPWGDGSGRSPLDLEAWAGPLEVPAISEDRPHGIVDVERILEEPSEHGEHRIVEWDASEHFGSETCGLRRQRIAAGYRGIPAHCHAVESELFVVLDGEGVLELGLDEEHPVRAGTVVARPPGTGVAHAFRASEAGPLTLLTFGQRSSFELVWYPRSETVLFGGIGGAKVRMPTADRLEYFDGEP